MKLELYIGVGKGETEFNFKGYKRQKIVLDFGIIDIVARNENEMVFAPSMHTLGFADMFFLSGSEAGPIIAKSPMLAPIYVGASKQIEIPPNTIAMSRKSANAIRNLKPIAIN